MSRYLVAFALTFGFGCHDHPPPPATQPPQPVANGRPVGVVAEALSAPDPKADPALVKSLDAEREAFIADTMAFLSLTRDDVIDKTTVHNVGMKNEWAEWEKSGPMTDARIKQFYKQTKNYIFDLGGWHLWDAGKYQSDLALVDELKRAGVKNVLDFGGGVGLNSLPIAKAGIDVTLADLDSVTLKFAMFRAERQKVPMKFWKSDVEAMPPDKKYDAILCLDVLEHLPPQELKTAVDKLIALKKPTTQIVIHAPFGRTATHPMHLDASAETIRQVERLKSELPQ